TTISTKRGRHEEVNGVAIVDQDLASAILDHSAVGGDSNFLDEVVHRLRGVLFPLGDLQSVEANAERQQAKDHQQGEIEVANLEIAPLAVVPKRHRLPQQIHFRRIPAGVDSFEQGKQAECRGGGQNQLKQQTGKERRDRRLARGQPKKKDRQHRVSQVRSSREKRERKAGTDVHSSSRKPADQE